MADFGIRFFICNLFICVIIVIFLIAKRALRNRLTSRMQFHLWYLLLGLLFVPFLPFRPLPLSQIFVWLVQLKDSVSPDMKNVTGTAETMGASGTIAQINDFALSVSSRTPSVIGLILFGIWLPGILAMLLLMAKSIARLNTLKKSALPLQSHKVRILFNNCLDDLKIKRDIPIYSAAFLKTPIIAGLFRPRIYLPLHLISDFNATEMRYMLLHELQHYKHMDALAGCLMNLIGVLYWFHPLVWYALKEMRSDREVACDTSVLELLDENDYEDYGNTLINFAEKISLTPFPFTAGISGTMKQMRKRILHISSYQKPSAQEKIKASVIFAVVTVMLLGFTPMLSTYALEQNHYKWKVSPEKIFLLSADDTTDIFTTDISAYFDGYEGSFVLYNQKDDTWSIYDMDRAALRTAPESTYKIYDALFGLEKGVIAPDNSFMAWDRTEHPFKAWNRDQDLPSAMQASVNWYFQKIDEQLGTSAIRKYVKEIGYGNRNTDSDLSSYWMQSTLKISPVEQVELLIDLYHNNFGFMPENIDAVKDSIYLPSSTDEKLYGKTGTGRVDGQDVNGWFIGFWETADNTCFFATNIQSDSGATGSRAAKITKAILADLV